MLANATTAAPTARRRTVVTVLGLVVLALLTTLLTTTSADAAQKRRHVHIVGDSFSAGWDGFGFTTKGWPHMTTKSLGVTYSLDAIGGTGYANGSATKPSFAERVVKKLRKDAAVVLVVGSQNDKHRTKKQTYDAARRTVQLIRKNAPKAKIVLIGPLWGAAPPTDRQYVEDAVAQAARNEKVTFVDGSHWLEGRTDAVHGSHPNDLGHQLLRDRIRPVLATALG